MVTDTSGRVGKKQLEHTVGCVLPGPGAVSVVGVCAREYVCRYAGKLFLIGIYRAITMGHPWLNIVYTSSHLRHAAATETKAQSWGHTAVRDRDRVQTQVMVTPV